MNPINAYHNLADDDLPTELIENIESRTVGVMVRYVLKHNSTHFSHFCPFLPISTQFYPFLHNSTHFYTQFYVKFYTHFYP